MMGEEVFGLEKKGVEGRGSKEPVNNSWSVHVRRLSGLLRYSLDFP